VDSTLEIRLTEITFPNGQTLSMRLKEYRRWKDDTLCARTSGQTATRLAKSRKTAKSFSITAAYVADAIRAGDRPRALAGRYCRKFGVSSFLRTV
jgi:hypothetical protein